MKGYVLQSTLTRDSFILMGSDIVDGNEGLKRGNAVSLMLNCISKEEIYNCFKALSAGGKAMQPLENTFWGGVSGSLTDKYGNNWLFRYDHIG